MKHPKRALIKCSLVVLFSTLLMAGCATTKQPGEVTPTEQKIAEYNQLPSLTAISKATKIYNDAKIVQLDFYAPTHYAVAGKALEEARALLATGSHQQITSKAAVIDAVIKNGHIVMRRVKYQLSGELALQNKLDSLNSKAFNLAEYDRLLTRLIGIIIEIENGNLISNEITRGQLLTDMKQLAQKSVHFNAMNEPKEVLDLVRQLGGEKSAPITYKQALDTFNHTTLFIKENPNDEQQISQAGENALFAAKHALHITQAVTALNKNLALSAEQIVLDEENRLLRILQEVGDADFRDHPLELQSSFISQLVKDKITELSNKDELVLALRDTIIETRDPSGHLSLVNATAESLQREKDEWLDKQAAYELKLAKLQAHLTAIKTQLNDTQNTIVDITTENIDITDLIEMKISEVKVLESKIGESLLENEKNRQTILALQAQIAKQLSESTVLIERDSDPISYEENREKITAEETLQALDSARELIAIYRNSAVTEQTQRPSLKSLLDNQTEESNSPSDVLVDANH